ncbi:MAG: TldD/PmbA family protein, partial [Rhodococcus sp. (in: high G+C Gram-positive bacteria)]
MIEAQELVERALRVSTADETIVLVTDVSEAALRWAGNSMTTNGVARSRSWTVLAIQRGPAARVGIVTSSSVD